MKIKFFFTVMAITLLTISTSSFAQRCGGGHGAKGSELGTKHKPVPKKKSPSGHAGGSVGMVGDYRDKIKFDFVLYRRNNASC